MAFEAREFGRATLIHVLQAGKIRERCWEVAVMRHQSMQLVTRMRTKKHFLDGQSSLATLVRQYIVMRGC